MSVTGFWCAGKSRARNIAQILTKSDDGCRIHEAQLPGSGREVATSPCRSGLARECGSEPTIAFAGKPAPTG
ncbi:hypothetical protein F3J45_20640 [Pantoea sp. Ap-967]|nr:hypothetical protein [Pantoea sp. Ap-967]